MHLKKKSISVCLSCFNESFYVIKNIKKIRAILRKINLKNELIVVDDASDEINIKKLRQFCKQNNVKYIRHENNLGFF